jgi:hypothetical protein
VCTFQPPMQMHKVIFLSSLFKIVAAVNEYSDCRAVPLECTVY